MYERRINKSIKSNFDEKIILKPHGVYMFVCFVIISLYYNIYADMENIL